MGSDKIRTILVLKKLVLLLAFNIPSMLTNPIERKKKKKKEVGMRVGQLGFNEFFIIRNDDTIINTIIFLFYSFDTL